MKLILTNDIEIQGASKDFISKVKEKLTMYNPKFYENERMGYFNHDTPKILQYFMEDESGFAVPRGFLNELILMSDKKPNIVDLRTTKSKVNFTFNKELRPYQDKATSIMLAEPQGVLQAPTGSGKTIMALYMAYKRQQPTIIIVHTKELLNQWMERIKTFLSIPKNEIGQIGGGKKTIGKKITIAMVQTLFNCAEQVYDKFGFLIVDECHRIVSRSFDEAVSWFDCKYFLGLSATPKRRDQLTNLIYWFIGPKLHEIKISEMIDKGAITSIDVKIKHTNFLPKSDPISEYSMMLSELTLDQKRNMLIVNDVIKEYGNGTILILSDRKRHCEDIQSLLLANGYDSTLLTGDIKTKERSKIVDKINNGDIKIVIATGQLIGEGFDCKNLSILFFATPVKYSGRVLQYIGRILRPMNGKDIALIYDYVDIHVKQLIKSAKERLKIYRKEFRCDKELFPRKESQARAKHRKK